MEGIKVSQWWETINLKCLGLGFMWITTVDSLISDRISCLYICSYPRVRAFKVDEQWGLNCSYVFPRAACRHLSVELGTIPRGRSAKLSAAQEPGCHLYTTTGTMGTLKTPSSSGHMDYTHVFIRFRKDVFRNVNFWECLNILIYYLLPFRVSASSTKYQMSSSTIM